MAMGLFGCGGQTSTDRRIDSGNGVGGATSNSAADLGGTGGTGGTVRTATVVTPHLQTSGTVCLFEVPVDETVVSNDCQSSVQSIDPNTTCAGRDCPIGKALNLTCDFTIDSSTIAATADGAALLARSSYGDKARLITVDAAGSRVQDVQAFADRKQGPFASSIAISSNGTRWLFTESPSAIGTSHETNAGWTHALDVSTGVRNQAHPYVTGARMVDDQLGYVTYRQLQSGSSWGRLLSWDGSCWTDEPIGDDAPTLAIAVTVDAQRGPWVAWISDWHSLHLRSPEGITRNLLSGADDELLTAERIVDSEPVFPLWLLDGGLDGHAVSPAVAAQFPDGIRIFANADTSERGWHLLLPRDAVPSGSITGDCPPLGPSENPYRPCLGMTTCNRELSAVTSAVDLVRTESGSTFVAWVEYSSKGSFTLFEDVIEREMSLATCTIGYATSGTGTAELVVARVAAGSKPVLSRFPFDLGGPLVYPRDDIDLDSRGEMLIVAAYLSESAGLTYLEIDSTRLP